MELDFTKFLDIKSPLGAYQLEQEGEFSPVGVDIYFPRPNKEFFDAIVSANKKLCLDHFDIKNNLCYIREKDTNELVFMYIPENEKYHIFGKKIQSR